MGTPCESRCLCTWVARSSASDSGPVSSPGAATREAFGKALVELGRANPNVVALDADLSKSTYSAGFQKEFPERFFECGIAEANMAAIAAGGGLPFVWLVGAIICTVYVPVVTGYVLWRAPVIPWAAAGWNGPYLDKDEWRDQ